MQKFQHFGRAPWLLLLLIYSAAAAVAANNSNVRRFEDLTPKNQAFVKDQYAELLSAYEKRDYQKMFERSRNILSLVDEYNDTKSYEAISKRGIDSIEEEKKRKQLEEKQKLIRAEVEMIEQRGDKIYNKGKLTKMDRALLNSLIQEIYAKDPNSAKAAEWHKVIREVETKEAAKLAEELRKKANKAKAELEIRGQVLLKSAYTNAGARAELYEIMDQLQQVDPSSTLPQEWRVKIHEYTRNGGKGGASSWGSDLDIHN